jgi:hypothetical protein
VPASFNVFAASNIVRLLSGHTSRSPPKRHQVAVVHAALMEPSEQCCSLCLIHLQRYYIAGP